MKTKIRLGERPDLMDKIHNLESEYGSLAYVDDETLNEQLGELRRPVELQVPSTRTNVSSLIVKLARQGLPAPAIAETLNVTYKTVWQRLVRAGVITPHAYRYRNDRGRYFKTIGEVAKFYHVTQKRASLNRIPGANIEQGNWTEAQAHRG